MILNIRNIECPSFASTDGVSIDVFFSGCFMQRHCSGCHNPELWEQHPLDECLMQDVVHSLNEYRIKYNTNRIALMGGEPMHQSYIFEFLKELKVNGYIIWLYTSKELHDLSNDILDNIEYVKTGFYMEHLKTDITDHVPDYPRLASKNQRIYKKDITGEWNIAHGKCFF